AELNQIVSAYLDLAENRAKRHITTTMENWALFLDSFLELSSYPVLLDAGKITAEQAKIKAYEEYNKFRVIQDRNYESDFDRELKCLEEKIEEIT
ncbi:MAG: virulence RhuM family protein, partial [Prevotellaceae bacterium]|nr:virulence RhuM family protein [Prevotellaceae bacterium]